MFNKFIKKSSKFFAVLLTATLAFTPLSYGATPTSFSNFNTLLSDGTVSDITLNADLTADTTDTTLGEQAADSLTINGADNSVSGADSAYGMKIDAGSSGPLQEKITEINNIEFKNFYKEDDGAVIYNKAGNITIKNSSFTANKGTVRGGAIYHKTKSDEQPEEHRYGSLTIQNSFFSGNEAFAMGAIHSEGVLTITDTVFENNKAEYMGVLGVTGSKKDKATLTNVTFSNNSSTNNDSSFPNSGVIYLGGEARISIADSTFENNTSAAEAGAIGSAFLDLGGEDPDFKNAQLDVTGSTFKKNTAQTNGGAIDNYFYGSEYSPTTNNETFEPGHVYVKDSTFEENKARNGGAIYNHGNIDGNSVAQMIIDGATKFIKNIAGISATVTGNGGAILNEGNLIINDGVEFSTNSASGKGGAIFNTSSGSEGGVIDFNGDATFIDNYTGSEDNKNDIYNDGTLNFNGKAGGATVTMTGGIVGSGDTNIGDAYNTNNTVSVKLGSDAKLEQNIIYINQNSSLEGNAANIKATYGGETPALYNEGSLILFTNSADAVSFANNVYDPTRTGTTTVKTGANIDMGNRTLQQYGLTVEEDATLTVNADILELGESGSGVATNNGNLIFKSATATTPMSNINEISGTGKLTIDGKVTNTENISISQNNGIEIAEGGEFTAFADDIKAAVTNNGTYDITGGTISYRITGGATKGFVDINTAEVKISSAISNSQIRLSTNVVVDKEEFLGDSTSDLTISNDVKIDMVNNSTGTVTLNTITVNPNTEWTLLIDADLATKTSDNFAISDTVNSTIGDDSQATINTINFLSDFESGETSALMQISNLKINLQVLGEEDLNVLKLYTTENQYIISTVNDDTGSYLKVLLKGVGSLPQIIYDGESTYSETTDEEVTAWIDDVNTLSANLVISGNNKTIKAVPATGVLEGINASTYTLTINDLAGFEGFNNAISVSSSSEYTGTLNVSTVTFKNNTGDAVIKNTGNTSLKNVTFEDNEVNADVENIGELLITGTAGETSFEKGVIGTGTTTVAGATVNFGGDAKFEQASISIEEDSQVTVNAANVKVTGINDILYNSGSLVLYSTNTDTIDFANPIMDVISAGTTTIKTENNIGANINMGDNDLQQYGLIIEEGSSLTVNPNKLNIEDQVVNDGSVTFKSATSATEVMVNKSTITTNGTGLLTIDGIVVNQEGTGISEADIYVLENSSFTASANDLTVSSEEGISNEGNLIFKSESDEQINENNISGNGKFFIDGSLINRAEVNQSSVTIGASIESMAINEGAIISTNVVINEGSTLVAKGEIDTYGDGEFENGKITNNGTFIVNVLTPEGEPDTVPNYNTIDGTGTLIISSTNFNVQDNAIISQSSVTIADVDSSLKVGVSSITVSPDGAVQNAGKFILTGEGTNENKVTYYNGTYGETIFDEGSQIINNANIVQSTITIKGTVTNTNGSLESVQTDPQAGKIVIESGAILITSATYVKADNHIAIADGGTLELTGGNNINNINTSLAEEDILTGTLIISGTDNTTNSGNIAVSTITVNPDISLTNEDGYYIATKTIEGNELINNGLFILNASKDSDYGLTNLTGVGTSSITVESGKTVTMNNTGTIEQATIETYGDGTLVLTGNNIIANVVNYMTGNCLDIATRIVGTLDNNPANPDTEGVVNILDGGSVSGLITNSTGTINITSTGFDVETGITSANTSDITKNKLNIGSGTVAGVVRSSNTIEYQTITVSSGSLQMYNAGKEIDDGTIKNSSITVATDGLLVVNPSKLENITDPITNNGIVDFYGTDVVNVSTITGTGELKIDGIVEHQDNHISINQSSVTISQGSSLTVNPRDITTTEGILNDGTLVFRGLGSNIVNTSTITTNGTGVLVIKDSEIESNANVSQKDIIIEGEFENQGQGTTIEAIDSILIRGVTDQPSEFSNNDGIVNARIIEINEYGKMDNAGVNGGTINVYDTLNSSGAVTISTGTLNAKEIVNRSSGTISNMEFGVINSTNVVNYGTITSSGTIAVEETLINNNIISVSSGSVTAGAINNIGASSKIMNESSSTITISGMLTNEGTIISSGSISATDITNEAGAVIESYGTSSEDGTYEGGTITSVNTAVNRGTVTANASGVDADIQNENGGIYNITGGTVTRYITGANGGTVNIKQSSVTVAEKAVISQNTINLEGTELTLEKESNLRSSDLNIGEGATFNIMNGSIDTVDINSINVGDGITWNFKFDVNLKLGTTDYLDNTSFANTSTMTINTINVLEDTDKATTTKLTIANTYSWADVTNPIYATTNVKYTIEQDLSITTATVLGITSEGYGGFPSAVYDGLGLYFVSGDSEGVHIENVKKWVDDGHGPQDTLIADMSLNGKYADSVLVSSPDAGTLTGVKTGSFTLRINDNEEAQGLTIKGFEDAITVNATDGRLEANNVVFSSNTGTAVITNEGITVLNGVTFDDTNTATYDVLNNGDLLLETSSSTFTKGIVGEGTTTIKGVAIDMGEATLAQGTVEISHVEGSSLTVKVDKLQYEREGSSEATVTNLIINNNELVLVGNEEGDEVATLATEIKGFGNTELQKNMDVTKDISQTNINLVGATVSVSTDTGAKLKATTISVDENSSLTADASNIDTFATNGGINNEGSVTFVGGTNNNTITGDQGKLFIDMNAEVINSTGTKITQQFIEVREDGKFVMNADDVETATDGDLKGIQNNGDLEITGGTNKNIIGRGDAVKGNTIISGIVTNAEGTSVEQSTITINSGASLTASANDLKKADGGIKNSGDLIFVGSSDMTNENDITGTGNLTIKSNMTSSTTITQTNIDIVDGTFTHNVADNGDLPKITATNISVSTSATFVVHSEVEVSDKVTNDGIFKINVLKPTGEADDVTSQNSIIGKGDMIISSTNYKNNGGTISQRTFTIEDADSSFETDITKFEAYNGITDNGNLIYTGTGTSSSTITGTGELTIGTADTTAEVVNKEGNEISLSTITVNEGSKFTASANDITTTVGMVNDAEVTFTGGVNKSTITMTNDNGMLNIENDLTNQAAITQKEIDIKGGDFENVRTSSVTAEKITVADGSKLITDAKDLDISDSITITGEETVLNLKDEEEAEIGAVITGAGKIVKEGEGTVTLSGENGYTGTTTITGGALRIVAASGISEEKIYMDGGKFITGENSEITLSNEIMGTDHNDVNIETEEGGSLILDGEIFGNKDLVKTGTGLLDLQMTSNSYVGDTVISSGTVRGTTKNINGKVIGSGAADSVVEFYDADGEVVLNEFDTEKFIGTFNKTGASTMTVTNNFKALNANVLSGTFVINNDSEMGSGSTFEVTEDMRVENALLKGYGDVTTGNLIIGQGATFAPGNSTTTFKVDGNLNFEEDGNYDVEFGQFNMDEAGHYSDNTTVTEKTEIGENAKITLNNLEGKYYVPETIDLITAGTLADGYEYKEDNVTFNDNDATDLRPGYETRISTRVYTEGNILKIDLQRKRSEYSDSLEFTRSHNEQEASTAIDNISTGNPGDITESLDAMEKMYYYKDTYDIDGLKAAFNDIAGVIHANSTMLTFTNAKIEHVYDKVKERTKDILPCQKMHDKIWAQYYYNTYQVNENENSPKFDTSVNGFLVGFDMISAKQWTMGVTAGYGTSELKQVNDKTTMNDINLGFYGGYETEKWLFKGMLLGGYEQYSTERTIGFMDRIANSEHNGYSAALDLEAGYKISLNKKDSQAKHKMYLKPYLGVTGSYINNEGFEEKGADSLNLKVEGYDNFAAQARAGIGINGKVKKFGWYAKAGVRQFLTEDYNEIESSLLDYTDQTQMKIRSAELDKFSYGGGLGVDFELSKAWTVFANGLASFADKSNNYYGNIGLMYKFGCPNNEKKTDEDVEKITAMLNDKMTEEEMLKRQLADKDKELANKEKELNDAKNREKELQNRIQKYEANVVSEQQAQKMKQNTVKTFRLGEKPTFVFGTDKLNKNGKESLKQVATELEGYPDAEVLVEGHTDNVGGDEINQKISEQRASAVATTLKKDYGVKNNISVIGKGKTEPIASNDTAAGRAQNRRVEIIITTND